MAFQPVVSGKVERIVRISAKYKNQLVFTVTRLLKALFGLLLELDVGLRRLTILALLV